MTIAEAAIGEVAIAEDLSPYADGAAAFILARNAVIYSCELNAALRSWAADASFNEAIGATAIGEMPSISRTYTAEPFYVATTPFGTAYDQSPANTWFQGRLESVSFRRSISNGSDFGGVSQGDGEIVIANGDGAFDTRIGQLIAGREIVIKTGLKEVPYDLWVVIFRGTAREWNFDDTSIRIAARDDSYRLGVPVQTTLYAGSGGAEGGASLKDKRKPLVLGKVINISPPQIDGALLTYQLNDGVLDAILAVRDRGSVLSVGADHATYALLAAAVIAGGIYDTCLAQGYIRLGSTPAGTVTADAATLRTAGKSRLSDIVHSLLAVRAGITAFNEAAFTALVALYPNDHGIFLGENDNSTVAEALDRLIGGVAGFVAFERGGTCTVGVMDVPGNPADDAFGMADVLDLSRERLPSLLSPPPWRLRLNHYQNWTVQTDLAGAADQFFAQPAKVSASLDSDVKLDHPLAQDRAPRDSFIVDTADADAEALRQLAIFKEERPLRRVRLPRTALPREIGDVIDLNYDRLGGRRIGIIVEDDINVPQGEGLDTVEVLLYG